MLGSRPHTRLCPYTSYLTVLIVLTTKMVCLVKYNKRISLNIKTQLFQKRRKYAVSFIGVLIETTITVKLPRDFYQIGQNTSRVVMNLTHISLRY